MIASLLIEKNDLKRVFKPLYELIFYNSFKDITYMLNSIMKILEVVRLECNYRDFKKEVADIKSELKLDKDEFHHALCKVRFHEDKDLVNLFYD